MRKDLRVAINSWRFGPRCMKPEVATKDADSNLSVPMYSTAWSRHEPDLNARPRS